MNMLEIPKHKYLVTNFKKNRNNYLVTINNQEYELLEETVIKYRVIKDASFDNLEEILTFNETAKYISDIKKYVARYQKSKYNYFLYFKNKYKELEENVIIEILDDLENKKMINDYNYAASKVNSLLNKKNSIYFIRETLIYDKVNTDIIDEILNEIETDDSNNIKSLISKLDKKYQKYDIKTRKQKIIKYLLTKGFKYNDIKQNLEEIKMVPIERTSLGQ